MKILPRYYFRNDFVNYRQIFIDNADNHMNYRTGEMISNLGESIHDVFYILEGTLKVSIYNENGKKYGVFFFGKDSMFPFRIDDWEFTLETSIYIETSEDSKMLIFYPKTLEKMILAKPELAIASIKLYERYSNLLIYHAYSLATDDSLTRVANFLYLFDYYGDKEHRDLIPLSNEEVAEINGVSRVQIQRILKQLRNEGILSTRNRLIKIENRDKLAEYCSDNIISPES